MFNGLSKADDEPKALLKLWDKTIKACNITIERKTKDGGSAHLKYNRPMKEKIV